MRPRHELLKDVLSPDARESDDGIRLGQGLRRQTSLDGGGACGIPHGGQGPAYAQPHRCRRGRTIP
jgi:hypothetical protein